MTAEGPARSRLDVPRQPRRLPNRPRWDPDTVGFIAERGARFIGTWAFISYMTVFVTGWIVYNTTAPDDLAFDKFPFIFLTLMLSLQASYAAPLILLAQNRQADRDRVTNEQDRQRTERNIADTEYLTREVAALRSALGDVATRDFIRSELARFGEDYLAAERDGDNDPTEANPERGDRDGR